MMLKFTHLPVIKNTIKRIALKNAYESSIIFQSFLYASIPAKSTPYAPTFFKKNTHKKTNNRSSGQILDGDDFYSPQTLLVLTMVFQTNIIN